MVLTGGTELMLDGKRHRLATGDGFPFASSFEHRHANPSNSKDAILIPANMPLKPRK